LKGGSGGHGQTSEEAYGIVRQGKESGCVGSEGGYG
jgi:hypothetical protein